MEHGQCIRAQWRTDRRQTEAARMLQCPMCRGAVTGRRDAEGGECVVCYVTEGLLSLLPCLHCVCALCFWKLEVRSLRARRRLVWRVLRRISPAGFFAVLGAEGEEEDESEEDEEELPSTVLGCVEEARDLLAEVNMFEDMAVSGEYVAMCEWRMRQGGAGQSSE